METKAKRGGYYEEGYRNNEGGEARTTARRLSILSKEWEEYHTDQKLDLEKLQ
jgi:hypothetical protein